jgi:hypothetical protein
MATRNSARYRVPGSPLAGVLRQAAQQTRSTTRRAVAVAGPPGADGVAGPPGGPGPAGQRGATGVAGTAGAGVAWFGDATANASGVAILTFDPPLDAPPIVTATHVASATVALVTVAHVSTTSATLQLWKWDASAKTFVASGGGVVHAAAYV